MVVFVSLHITLPKYHYHADLSEGIKTFRMIVKYIVSVVCVLD